MHLIFPIQGAGKEKIPAEEIRTEIRKIEEQFYGKIANSRNIDNLNETIERCINKPYGLLIKAEFINNNVKLYGYNDDSKIVLDPNCNIEYISKTRVIRK